LWNSDPYGLGFTDSDPDGDGQVFVYNLRLPGQYYDVETGLNYNYSRDYDPATGRYVESDPIGLAGGSYSTYAYADGNPVSNSDATGQFVWFAIPGICAAGGCEALAAAMGFSVYLSTPAGQEAAEDAAAAAANAASAVANAMSNSSSSTSATSAAANCPNQNECDRLNQRVQAAKKKVGPFGACKEGMSLPELDIRYDLWLELATARAIRDVKCWNGGDEGHQSAQADAWRQVGRCTRLKNPNWYDNPGAF
jgi:RHS repeat-associated protein